MGIVTTALESMAAYLSTSEAQTVSTLTAQSQSAEVEVTFKDNTGQCKDAVREVKFITPVPLMVDSIDYWGIFLKSIPCVMGGHLKINFLKQKH